MTDTADNHSSANGSDEVESSQPNTRNDRYALIVDLKVTPERLRYRRIGIALSVIPSVLVLVFMALGEFQYSIDVAGYALTSEYYTVFGLLSQGDFIFIMFTVLAVIAAVLGILSAQWGWIAALWMLFSVLNLPEEVTVNGIAYASAGEWVVPAAIAAVLLVIGVLGYLFSSRSVNKGCAWYEKDTKLMHYGLLYNVDSKWYRVLRNS